MTRDMTPEFEAALLDQTVRVCLFFEADFPSGTLHLWTGYGPIDWNGETWIGAGNLVGVSEISETGDIVANGITVSLSGVPVSLISLVISDAQQGLPGKVHVGLLDDAGAVIADPVQAFAGRLDVPEIVDGAETCVINITYESRLVDLLKPREFRYTHEGQRLFYPNDLGFEYVTQLQDRVIKWGG